MDGSAERLDLRPIGRIHSPHRDPGATPIQPCFASGVRGRVEVFPPFEGGLLDIEGFSHLYLLYHLHRAPPPGLEVVPFMEDEPHGVFATRHPGRPNALGLSLVRLIRHEGRWLEVEDLDVLDGTPLLDLKPYYPAFDRPRGEVRGGWVDRVPGAEAERRGRRLSRS